MQSKSSIMYILILVVLIWYHFFAYVGFSSFSSIFDGICYVAAVVMFIISANAISFEKYKLPTLILISTILSMFMSNILWNQEMFDIIKGFRCYFLILVFFFLCAKNADVQEVEKALVMLAIIYVFCWIYQILKVPDLIFGMDKSDDLGNTELRGFYRFWIPTKENMPILLLYFFEKYRRTKHIAYLILVPVCLLIIVLHVGRQIIFWSFLSFVILILYHYRTQWKKIVLSAVIVYALFNIMVDYVPTLNLLFAQTETQMNSAEDDIRLKCMNFYWEQSVKNPVGFLFGNGIGGGGELLKFTEDAKMKGYYESDIGYFALLFDFGLFGLVTYILLFVQILRMKINDKYIYLKCYLIYIYGSYALAHALTTNIFFNMCAIYIIYHSQCRNVQAEFND